MFLACIPHIHRHEGQRKQWSKKSWNGLQSVRRCTMCLSGSHDFNCIVLVETEKGNVIPGLVIAVLGVTTNSWFWLRFRKLNRNTPDAILAVQSKLYRAKALVDACVTASLAFIAVAPFSPAARYVDLIGSIIVAVYLVMNGFITLQGKKKMWFLLVMIYNKTTGCCCASEMEAAFMEMKNTSQMQELLPWNMIQRKNLSAY